MNKSDATTMHWIYRCAIAAGVAEYLKKRHSGLMIPCAYIKQRSEDVYDAGIAFFVGTDATSYREEKATLALDCDEKLGVGANHMISDMMEAFVRGLDGYGVKELVIIDMGLCPRLAIGSIVMYFAIRGDDIIVTKSQLDKNDPVWERVVRAGFSSLPYVPLVPFGIEDYHPEEFGHI